MSERGLPAVDVIEELIAVELGSNRYRNGLQELKKDVLFNLRRICRAGLKLL